MQMLAQQKTQRGVMQTLTLGRAQVPVTGPVTQRLLPQGRIKLTLHTLQATLFAALTPPAHQPHSAPLDPRQYRRQIDAQVGGHQPCCFTANGVTQAARLLITDGEQLVCRLHGQREDIHIIRQRRQHEDLGQALLKPPPQQLIVLLVGLARLAAARVYTPRPAVSGPAALN